MTNLFTGLSAFPLTPLVDDQVDEQGLINLIKRLASSDVDSITVLGSTGCYPYLTQKERARVAKISVEHAGSTPVFVGVGDLRTSQVLAHVESAEKAGAAGVLLPPMTYQALTEDDVFELYRTVTAHTQLPVIVYDNPGTTHFTFTTELYGRIATLYGIASIKIPGEPLSLEEAQNRIAEIRAVIPDDVTIGISGDAFAATGLNAGCDVWYSVIGGTLLGPALRIIRAAQEGRASDAVAESERLSQLWDLFAEFGGSLRVVAAIAEQLKLVQQQCLPLPIQGLSPEQRLSVAKVVDELGLA